MAIMKLKRFSFLVLLGFLTMVLPWVVRAADPTYVLDEEHHFSQTLPAGWHLETNEADLKEGARQGLVLMLKEETPGIGMALMVMDIDFPDFTLDTHVRFSMKKDSEYFKKLKLGEVVEEKIYGMKFLKYDGTGEGSRGPLSMENWQTFQGGRLYMLRFLAKKEDQALLKTKAVAVVRGFKAAGAPFQMPAQPVAKLREAGEDKVEQKELEFILSKSGFAVAAPSEMWVVSPKGKRLWNSSPLLLQEGESEPSAFVEANVSDEIPAGVKPEVAMDRVLAHVKIGLEAAAVTILTKETLNGKTFMHISATGAAGSRVVYRENWATVQGGRIFYFRFEGDKTDSWHVGNFAKHFCKTFRLLDGDVAKNASTPEPLVPEPVPAPEAKEFVVKDQNFALKRPSEGDWVRTPNSMGSETSLTLSEKKHERAILVQTKDLPGMNAPADDFVQNWEQRMKDNPKLRDVSCVERVEINRQPFYHANWLFSPEGKLLYVDTWSTVKEGRFYQFMVLGHAADQDAVVKLARETAEGFRTLGQPLEPPALKELNDGRWGVVSSLGKLGWHLWEEGIKSYPGAILHVYQGMDSTVVVYPLPNASGKLDFLTAAKSLLSQINGLTWEKCESSKRVVIAVGAEEAVEVSCVTSNTDNPIRWVARIIKGKGRYVLVLGSATKNPEAKHPELNDAVAAISLKEFPRQPEPSACTKAERKVIGLLLHTAGLRAQERQEFASAGIYFSEALAWNDNNARTLEGLAVSLRAAGQPKQALEALQTHQDENAKDTALAVLQARLEYETGDLAGMDHLRQIFADGYRGEEDLIALMSMFWEQKKPAEALAIVQKFLEEGGGSRVKRWLATAYDFNDQSAKALELLEELVAEPPFDPENGFRYLEVANNVEAYDKTLKLAAKMKQDGHESARLLMAEGWAHGGQKDWALAKQCFEAVAKQAPNEPIVKEAIARASAALGEGDNSKLKTKLDPLPMPADLESELARAKAQKPPENASGYFEHRVTVLQYEPQKPMVTTIYRSLRVLDISAVQDYATMSFTFDPLTEDLYVNQLIVRNPDGSEAARLKPEEQYIVDESIGSAMATQRKVVRLAVPGLKVGRSIELVLTRREKEALPEFPWQRVTFGTILPSKFEAVVVMSDAAHFTTVGNELFKQRSQVTTKPGQWIAMLRDEPQLVLEEHLPPPDAYMASVCLGASKADWQQLAKDYLKSIREKLEPDETVTNRAKELTKDCHSLEDKVKALAHAVQKEINYQGIEFGRRARIPNAASKVLSCHYGDCKDQALLLRQMLRSVDVPACLALVSTSYDVVRELPSMDQFNHMIVYVPGLPAAFVDTTGRHNPVGDLPPTYYARSAVIMDPDGSRVVDFPPASSFPPDEITTTRQVTFDDTGAARVRETQTTNGEVAATLREFLSASSREERRANYQQMHRQSDWQLDDLQVENLDTPGIPLIVKTEYRISNSGGAWRLPKTWEMSYLSVGFSKERRFPFELFHPIKFSIETTLTSSQPISEETLKSMEATGTSDFMKWQLVHPATNQLRFTGESTRGRFPKERHAAWHESGQKALEALSKPLR